MLRSWVRWLALALGGVAVGVNAAIGDVQPIEQGRELYRENCEMSHGAKMVTTSKLVFTCASSRRTRRNAFATRY